ncbi:MAG: helicase-related protein, partial [Thermodesulfobacteriota bacterium]
IGYAVRYDSKYSEDTAILFVTPGVALRWFAADRLAGFSCLILDEFHERRWDTDLLAALARGHFSRLVITSATVEGQKLISYFRGTGVQAAGRLYPVEVEYLNSPTIPSTKDLADRVCRAVLLALDRIREGDVLVFLPGRREISEAREALRKERIRAEVLPLHATVDLSIQDRVLRTEEHRRIILSTNVAETSLTLPGVRAVVDSGLERRTQHRNARTVLALSPVSEAAAEQRRGRAGRLGPGFCLRLWGRAARLKPYTPPEIVREELTELFLAAAVCGESIEDLEFPDPLPEQARTRARERLARMQALDPEGRITAHGLSFFKLPLDPLFAHLIMSMPGRDSREMMVDLAAALSVQGRIFSPPQNDREKEELKKWAPEPCDAVTLIRLVRGRGPGGWASGGNQLREAVRIAEQTRELLGLPGLGQASGIDRETFVQAVIRAVPELVYVRRAKRRGAMGNEKSEVEIGRDSRMPARAEAAIVFDQHSTPGKGTSQTLNFATCLAPVSLKQLYRLGIGRVEYSAPRIKQGRVVVRARRIYAGREIAVEEEKPRGADLCRVLADLILAKRLWPETGAKLNEDIAAWNLYCQLEAGSGEPVEPREWLAGRLEAIGLETEEDLELIRAEDLDFQGVPEWERDRFDRSWPRSVDLHDLILRVEYDPASRVIELIRLSGTRKTAPRRSELPSWGRNWTLRYREGNRVITVE